MNKADVFTDNQDNLLVQNGEIVIYGKETAGVFALRNYLRRNKIEVLNKIESVREIYDMAIKKCIELELDPNKIPLNKESIREGIFNIDLKVSGKDVK